MDRRPSIAFFAAVVFLAACGGGSGNVPSAPAPAPTPTPTPNYPATQTQTAAVGGSVAVVFSPISGGISGSMTLPATAAGSAQATLVLQSTLPTGAPALAAGQTPLAYVTATLNSLVTFASSPAFSFAFPSGALSGYGYVMVYDPAHASAGWSVLAGPVNAGGTALKFSAVNLWPPMRLQANAMYVFAILTTTSPIPAPTPTLAPVGGGAGLPSPLPNVPSSVGWSPYQIASALQYPVQSGYNGSGVTVAVLMSETYSATALNHYLTYFGIPSTSRTITFENSVDGAAPATAGLEVMLDMETVASLAPGANIIQYGMPDLGDQTFTDTVNQVITDGKATVMTYSAGGCEFSTETADTVLAQAAKAGIAMSASAGDSGNECWNGPNNYVVGVNWPASDPYVASVGGTNTSSATWTDAQTLATNAVWNDAAFCGQACAGGGGISQYLAIPGYQTGLTGAASTTMRNVPDVSMPGEGMTEWQGGSWFPAWGTSWSSPLYAALIAEVYQYCGTSFQYPVEIPYYVQDVAPSAFVDVTQGNNQFGGSTPFQSATAGYDNASGLGVPLGVPFANAICPNHVPAAIRRTQVTPVASHAPAIDRTVDVTPRLSGLADMGRRGSAETTRVQIVMLPTATIAQDERHVVDELQRAGFTIVRTFSNHLVVDATAPSASVERFFRARMENVSEGQYGRRYMPVTQAVIPSSIAAYVSGITLDNVVTMHVPR